VLRHLTDAVAVERVVGLWALGTLIVWIGAQLSRPTLAGAVPAIQREWTTTGRLSVWARRQHALTDPTGRLRAWLEQTLVHGAERLATATAAYQPNVRVVFHARAGSLDAA
jgi:hypothetical protein